MPSTCITTHVPLNQGTQLEAMAAAHFSYTPQGLKNALYLWRKCGSDMDFSTRYGCGSCNMWMPCCWLLRPGGNAERTQALLQLLAEAGWSVEEKDTNLQRRSKVLGLSVKGIKVAD